jgi:hypothetical protein
MTLTAITSYEEVVPASAPRLVLLSAPTYEERSTSDVNVLNKSIVGKARGFLVGLFVVAALFVAVGVFHVGAITPSPNTGPTAQRKHLKPVSGGRRDANNSHCIEWRHRPTWNRHALITNRLSTLCSLRRRIVSEDDDVPPGRYRDGFEF